MENKIVNFEYVKFELQEQSWKIQVDGVNRLEFKQQFFFQRF